MRYLFMLMVAWWMFGCAAGIPPTLLHERIHEVAQWQRSFEKERARTEALAEQLAAAESELERVELERTEGEQARQALNEEIARLEAELNVLEENNALLQARQRELAEMQEQMSDKWFESALSRARRHNPPPPAPAPPVPSNGQGATP